MIAGDSLSFAKRIEPEKSFSIELPPYSQDLSDAGKGPSYGWGFTNSFCSERYVGGIERGRPPFEAGCSAKDTDYLHVINWRKAEGVAQAGKTTTMRMIATLLNPDYGEAYVCGKSIYTDAREIRRLVGFMPDFFGVYDDMKVIEYLEFFAAAYRIKGPARRKKCDQMLEIVDLDFKRDAYANTLSRGQTQRLGLARVLLHDPQVLLLDEPLSALDQSTRHEMQSLLLKVKETTG